MGIKSFIKNLKEGGRALKGEPVKDKVYESEREFTDITEAMQKFSESKERLFHVDKWSDIPGISSKFELHDKGGQRLTDQKVKRNNFIRVLMPGASPENWVKVTQVVDKQNEAYIVASPSEDPTDPNDQKIEHFFAKEATSTFKVELVGNKIKAFEIGENEGANTGEDAGKRDAVNVLLSGAGWAGFQRIQWKNLTDYLAHLD